MAYENDFVDEKLIEFDIDGRKFKYKPITAEEELDWAHEYIEEVPTEEGVKRVQNFKKLTKCQLRAIKEVPYEKENIKNAIGVDKEFKDLTIEERDRFWGRLNPGMLTKIVQKLKEASADSEVKKN